METPWCFAKKPRGISLQLHRCSVAPGTLRSLALRARGPPNGRGDFYESTLLLISEKSLFLETGINQSPRFPNGSF
jgi:hypothetical protein